MTEWPEIERITNDNRLCVKTYYKGKLCGIVSYDKGANIDQLEQELRADMLRMISR